MEPITVYVKTSGFCGPCAATRTALDRAGITYTTIAIEDQPASVIEDFNTRIGTSAPIVITPTDAWSGFRPDLIATSPPNPAGTPAMTALPYPTVDTDGSAVVDIDGENQTCACSNDTYAADTTGAITFTASASTNPDEHTLCPACGRLYRNADLFTGTAVAVVRYDTHSPTYLAALAQYERDAYGKDQPR